MNPRPTTAEFEALAWEWSHLRGHDPNDTFFVSTDDGYDVVTETRQVHASERERQAGGNHDSSSASVTSASSDSRRSIYGCAPVRMGYSARMPAKKMMRPDDEVGWTVRMPASLAKRIRERAEALTAKGNGKWNGNMVMLKAINAAAETWDEESGK